MSDNRDLLNDKDVCSFEEHEAENVCSNKDAVACGDGLFAVKEIKSSAEKWRISGLFARLVSSEKPCEKLGFIIWKYIYFSVWLERS